MPVRPEAIIKLDRSPSSWTLKVRYAVIVIISHVPLTAKCRPLLFYYRASLISVISSKFSHTAIIFRPSSNHLQIQSRPMENTSTQF